jgi:hypothetical protein
MQEILLPGKFRRTFGGAGITAIGNSLAEEIFASAGTSQLVTYRSLFRTSPAISRTPKLTFFYNRGLIIDGHEWSMARAQFLTS